MRSSMPSGRYDVSEAAEIVALWNLAVAQPLYDLLARNPEFFVVRGTTLGEAVFFAVTLSLLSPLLLVAVSLLTGSVSKPGRFILHHLIVAVLVAILVLNGAKALPLPAAVLAAAAVASGALAAWALWRWSALRSWAGLVALSALVFPLIFLWRTPAATWSGDGGMLARSVSPPAHPVPIVFVVFDELSLVSLLGSDGEIDEASFPNFATLAGEANWYPLATSVSDFTTLALPALLTGRLVRQDQLPTLADHPENLFTLLDPHYEIVAQESMTQLCPPRVCARGEKPFGRRLRWLYRDLGLAYSHIVSPPAWAAMLPPVDQTWNRFGGGGEGDLDAPEELDRGPFLDLFRQRSRDDRAAAFLAFLDSIEASRAPTLYFYADTLPHVPFDYLPSGRRYSVNGEPAGLINADRWGDDSWAIVQDHQRHLLQVGFTDRQLGLLVQRLRDVGLYDRALLVVAADHGVSFRPRRYRRTLTAESFAEIMSVPVFLKLPGQLRGHRDDRAVETIDVLPTILDAIGARFSLEGQSLLSAPSHPRQHRVVPLHAEPGTVRRYASVELRRGIEEAVRLKTDRFGSQGFSTRFFQIGEFGSLVGKRVAELGQVVDSPIETELFLPSQDTYFDPTLDFVPAHVAGRSQPVDGDRRHHFAIAINETVGAVTRTWKESLRHRRGEWSAILPEAMFVPGANDIEVFHLQPTPGGVRLARTNSSTGSPTRTDLLGVRPVFGVRESGFHTPGQQPRGRLSRWTDGHARLELPLSGDPQSRVIRIKLLSTGPRGTRLQILLNGSQVLRERLPPGEWVGEFPLDPVADGSHLEVDIISDTFVPARVTSDSEDTRQLGVAVGSVRLLDASP